MEKKQFAVATLFAAVLLTTIIVPLSTQQEGGAYDPWLDYNDDGIIDVSDLQPLGGSYGTMGDPTKNVNVTNWPQSAKPLFPEYLYLRAQKCWDQYTLIDENTQYVPYLDEYDQTAFYLNPTEWTKVYDRQYVYEKMPGQAYQIMGRPTISYTVNFTTYDNVVLSVLFNVTLWKVLPDSSTEKLCQFNLPSEGMSGILGNHQVGKSYSAYSWFSVAIGQNERLMVRLTLHAYLSSSPGASLWSSLIFRKNTDDFRLDIPIVTNP